MLRRDILTGGLTAALVLSIAPASAEDAKTSLFKVVTTKDLGLYDPALESTDYLVEGINGSLG